jgi:hypothetical protein
MSSGTAASAPQSMAAMDDSGPWSSHAGQSAESGRPGWPPGTAATWWAPGRARRSPAAGRSSRSHRAATSSGRCRPGDLADQLAVRSHPVVLSACVRATGTVKTASGAAAVQIVWSYRVRGEEWSLGLVADVEGAELDAKTSIVMACTATTPTQPS